MRLQPLAVGASLAANLHWVTADPLVFLNGQVVAIPSWDLASSASIGTNLAALSKTGVDTSSWHHVKTSKCTLIGCLINAGVYNETHLFYSENLKKVDERQFAVPWTYRNEYRLEPGAGKHFFLKTHGISSRADIFLNGKQVASKAEQAGSFAGRTYDITKLVDKQNALAIQVHPTSYYHDFALGWVDWNPWPADNGSGIWRDVEVKQTGPVALETLRIVTKLGPTFERLKDPATVTLKARAENLENRAITVTAHGSVFAPFGRKAPITWSKQLTLPPRSVTDIVLETTVPDPAIWWPKQWGEQPLYSGALAITVNHTVSDSITQQFGFRSVTSKLNSYEDITYIVNHVPFQVIGAGYTPNIFLQFDPKKWEAELQYVLDLGFNTVRLEGKNEHPILYEIANRLGIFLMPGWECCDKWESWSYNHDLFLNPPPVWSPADYTIANNSMLHEAAMLQPHPSVLTYLIGSDYWPDERATPIYLNALKHHDWQTPVVGSASKRGYSPLTGPSGMKMEGPYDWVPPNYWYETDTPRAGSAFSFGSELGAGVGTPTLSSLQKFLSASDLQDLWKSPTKPLYHMSREGSEFTKREIYHNALVARWGAPASLDDYLIKAQIMDYEATRAQFEGFAAKWTAKRPATGLIYWMLNNAWPSLHWNVWDYYMKPAGSYYGAKTGSRKEHVVYDYVKKEVWIVDRTIDNFYRERSVDIQALGLDGKVKFESRVNVESLPNASRRVAGLYGSGALGNLTEGVFLRLVLRGRNPTVGNGEERVLSRNVYWLSKDLDRLRWDKTTWFVTPVEGYANYKDFNKLATADVTVGAERRGEKEVVVNLENRATVPAFFVSLELLDQAGNDVLPLTWEDNYVTLWPGEKMSLVAKSVGSGAWQPASVRVGGKNVKQTLAVVS
ncbi:family 2 putative glycoside hydrolase [Triangularia verruculosa]|uniref:Family 2 putative glycoside hydrolase n=1 Tax=Triangularia verruculosa TaxID=2587418 RepID=A0AAN6X7V3_9PEZI|nr:family 2 putative glycoside hydrolase [Triangularia verruculosa]